MQADYLILADAVAAAEGKLYIHGAGWDTLFVPAFPATHPMLGVGTRLRVSWKETNQEHVIEVDVRSDGDGNSILPDPPGTLRGAVTIGRPVYLTPGSDQALPLALNFTNLEFRAPGMYVIVLRVNERDLATSRFNVISLGVPE